jgi:hypothetical protein
MFKFMSVLLLYCVVENKGAKNSEVRQVWIDATNLIMKGT